jgi:hypothetical protein
MYVARRDVTAESQTALQFEDRTGPFLFSKFLDLENKESRIKIVKL